MHVFLMQLSVSLVGGELARLNVATLGMADWKLRPSCVPADYSCTLNCHSTLSSCAILCRGEESKGPFTTHAESTKNMKGGNSLHLLLHSQTHPLSVFLS